jgi:hypothetical protein
VSHRVSYRFYRMFGVLKFRTRTEVDIVQEKRNILAVKQSRFNISASAGNGECIFCYFRFRCGRNVNVAHDIQSIEMLLSVLLRSVKCRTR